MNKEELMKSAQKLAEAVAVVMPADYTVTGGLYTKKNDHEISYITIQPPGVANEDGDKMALRLYVNDIIYDIDHKYIFGRGCTGFKKGFLCQVSKTESDDQF